MREPAYDGGHYPFAVMVEDYNHHPCERYGHNFYAGRDMPTKTTIYECHRCHHRVMTSWLEEAMIYDPATLIEERRWHGFTADEWKEWILG